jgi:hypothetical protein
VARWCRYGLSVAGPFGRRCLTSRTMLRFHIPLIEPDLPISGIRLSDRFLHEAHGNFPSPHRTALPGTSGSCGVARLAPITAPRFPSTHPEVRPLPSTGVTRLPRYYEPLRHPTRPGLTLARCQLTPTAVTAGTSRVASDPRCLHADVNTPAGQMKRVRSYPPSTAAFPRFRAGRLLHCPFRGLLNVHSHFGLQARQVANTTLYRSAPTASLPPLSLRLLPGGANQIPGGDSHSTVDQRLSSRRGGKPG